jgi:hypothetical protein
MLPKKTQKESTATRKRRTDWDSPFIRFAR